MGNKKEYELKIEIGHRSTPFTKRLANGYTHKWTVFVRGVNDSKIENCISRVVFQLHESFPNHIREITEAPFSVKETGYAGFEIPIEIHFRNRDKPNRLNFNLDLCLLTSKPHQHADVHKLTFKGPNKDFEKCLIKSGAQLLPEKLKQERSSSPPAKRQKSSALIPSKDMSKQPQSQTSTQHHHKNHNLNHHHHHHSKSSSSSQIYNNNNHSHSHSNNNNNNNNNINDNGSYHRQTKQQASNQQQQSLHKPKSSSKEFVDLFGAPLVYNKHKHGGKDDQFSQNTTSNHSTTTNLHTSSHHNPSTSAPTRNHEPPQVQTSAPATIQPQIVTPAIAPVPSPIAAPVQTSVPTQIVANSSSTSSSSSSGSSVKPEPHSDPNATEIQMIQTKISSLSDYDRLQKIVDIVEESGEWFNVTPKKFLFDLKRLDRKTLKKIERCLQLCD